MQPKAICFTGHRPQKLGGFDECNPVACWVKDQLFTVIRYSVAHGFTRFISGGAPGVDTWAAEIVLDTRESNPVKLLMAIPCKSHDAKWMIDSRVRYRQLMKYANSIVFVPTNSCLTYEDILCQHNKVVLDWHGVSDNYLYNNHCMQDRNEWMVDHADTVIAVWDGTSGGTANCVKYAQSQGKSILRIDPKERTVKWSR